VPFEGIEVGTDLAYGPLGRTIVDVHVRDGREVYLGAVETLPAMAPGGRNAIYGQAPDGSPEDLPPLV
jgi:hypothetical protein